MKPILERATFEFSQEAIKKVYGEYWNKLSDSQKEYTLNNNGWIRIESEDDIPKTDIYVYIIFNKKLRTAFLCDGEFYNPNKVKYRKEGVTHYRLLEEPNLPIY